MLLIFGLRKHPKRIAQSMAYKKIWDQPKPRDTQKSRINVNIKRKKDTNIKEKD